MKSRVFLGVICLAAVCGACGPSQADYDARVHDVAQLRGQLHTIEEQRTHLNDQMGTLRAQSEQMANRLRALGEDMSHLQETNTQTQSELEASHRREEELRRQQQQAEERLATFRQMIERFRAMINSGQLRVRIVRGRMVIELPAGILFESGDARLRAAGEEVLRQVAQVLRQIPDRDFLIAGHTDNVQLGRGGRYRDNWELSTARAVNVSRFLQENGLAPQHLGAAGYAEFQPANANDSPEHQALNRRVEIVLMPNINELPDLSGIESTSSTTPRASPAPAP